jgi:hypothetical protein
MLLDLILDSGPRLGEWGENGSLLSDRTIEAEGVVEAVELARAEARALGDALLA